MSARKYDAVIFDLFGTLVDDVGHPEPNAVKNRRVKAEMADAVGVSHGDFLRVWDRTVSQRDSGVIQNTEAGLRYVFKELGISVDTSMIQDATRIRLDYYRQALLPRDDAIETLKALKPRGYKVGLVSNCSDDVSVLWPTSPFAQFMNAAVLSCDVGLMKPDPRIYQLACQRLGVKAERCLFVGDGSNNELTGASEVGMDAVLIRTPDDAVDGKRQAWDGARVSSLRQVLLLSDSEGLPAT